MLFVTRAVTLSWAAALTTGLGNTTGHYLQVAAGALGVGVLVERSVLASWVVKLFGALYLGRVLPKLSPGAKQVLTCWTSFRV